MGMKLSFVVQAQLWVLVQQLVPWAEVLVHCWLDFQHFCCWQEAGGLYSSPPHPLHHLQ